MTDTAGVAPRGLRQHAGAPVRLDALRNPARPRRGAPIDVFAAPTARLDSLTGLRFIAAILVVIHHSVSNPNHTDGIATLSALEPLATIGYTGVSFFFALSGFVLAWSWRPGRGPKEFWIRRFARVYPLHLVTWLLAIAFAIWVGRHVDVLSAVIGGLLLQAWSPDSSITFALNAPSWSLSCEAFFYAMFPLLILPLSRLSVRWLQLVMAAAFVVLLAVPVGVWVVAGRSAVGILYYFPAYRVLEFVIGICLALAMRRGWRPKAPAWSGPLVAVVGIVVVVALGALYVAHVAGSTSLPRPAAALVMLPFYVAVIAIAAARDIEGRRSVFSRPFMVRLGTWSFAAYMTHLLLLEVVERVAAPLLPVEGPLLNAAVVAVVLVGATLMSALAYSVVEHPLERFVRFALIRRPKVASTRPTPLRIPQTPTDSGIGHRRGTTVRRILVAALVVVAVIAASAVAWATHPWEQRAVVHPRTSSARAAAAPVEPAMAVVGDGVSVGDDGPTRWPLRLANALDVRVQLLGGATSGFAGANGFDRLVNRIDPGVAVVVVMAGRGDARLPTLSLVRSTTAVLTAAKRSAPHADVLLIGPVWAAEDAASTRARAASALAQAATSAQVTWVDPASRRWFARPAPPARDLISSDTETILAGRVADLVRAPLEANR